MAYAVPGAVFSAWTEFTYNHDSQPIGPVISPFSRVENDTNWFEKNTLVALDES